MADYIKRDDAIRELNAEGYTKNMRIHKRILDIPAADVRENVPAKWLKVSDKYPRYSCSNCHRLYNNKSYKFCPFCGADMFGGEKDDGKTGD